MSLGEYADQSEPQERRVTEPEWTFGLRLRALRKALGYREQAPMAKRINVNPSSYSAWEADREEPRDIVQMAKKIQIATGCDPEWLLGLRTGSIWRALTCIDGSGESSSRLPKPSLVVVQ